MEGDALVKQLTGATVMAMAEDVPALEKMTPGGKPHPIDKVLHDGDEVKLGGMTLVAHLTPGHTRGCTTWTFKETEGGKSYDVLIIGSVGVNPGMKLVNNPDAPQIVEEFNRSFVTLRGLPSGYSARLASRDVRHGGEIRQARQRAEPVHRSRRLQGRARHRRGRVQIGARAAAAEVSQVQASSGFKARSQSSRAQEFKSSRFGLRVRRRRGSET